MDIFLYVIACLYFFAPAYAANAAPPLVANHSKLFLSLAKPIDGNKKLFGRPILGDHKTWRGIFAELIVGTGYFQILFLIHNFFSLNFYQVIGFNQHLLNPLVVGFLISVGTIVGDLIFAFVKRRLDLKPGKPFIPFDQINYCLGCFIFLQPIFNFSPLFWIVLLPLTFLIHLTFNRLGYNLGLHKAKW